jgi:NAD(P)H dehydrogenase (quinone)
MCFPSKSQKTLYSDQAQPDTKAPAPAPVTTTTTSTTPIDPSMAPNVAIVIYTLYGHIAKCSSLLSFLHSYVPSLLPLCFPLVAEAEKKGIEAAGGNVTIYQ